ncbi:hypothetical protein OSB04_015494 [Centaurea solstitialis]|uniref:F-box associated domain-containing protein n=1 Tax=Centaurea solstitialis TaxID=347529 RepID=A0AA38WIT6_9ASTR|nr:hypothetical protein OSB04_015494 [Centaurea solstitialis]
MAVIWNPAIRRSVAVAVPDVVDHKFQFRSVVGFGVCPATMDPKLVNITFIDDEEKIQSISCIPFQVMVFTLSSGQWTTLSGNLPRKSIQFEGRQTVIGHFIYLVGNDWSASNDEGRTLIMSFDLTTHEFAEVDIPNSLHDSYLSVSSLRESLVLLHTDQDLIQDKDVFHVWMMDDGDSKAFTKLFTINPPNAYVWETLGFRESGEPIIEWTHDETDGTSALGVYEPGLEDIKDLGIRGNNDSFNGSSSTESLLLLDHEDGRIIMVKSSDHRRLPIKSLLRFRSVCKAWKSIHLFIRLYCWLHHSLTAATSSSSDKNTKAMMIKLIKYVSLFDDDQSFALTVLLSFKEQDYSTALMVWSNSEVSFDLTTHEFAEVDIPNSLHHSYLSLSRLRESLVLLHTDQDLIQDKEVFHVWMMDDGDSKEFTKLFTINPPNAYLWQTLGFRESGEPIIEWTQDEMDRTSALGVYEPGLEDIRDLGFVENRSMEFLHRIVASVGSCGWPHYKVLSCEEWMQRWICMADLTPQETLHGLRYAKAHRRWVKKRSLCLEAEFIFAVEVR